MEAVVELSDFAANNVDHGWQKVTYAKRRKQKPNTDTERTQTNGEIRAFRNFDQEHRIKAQEAAAIAEAVPNLRLRSDGDVVEDEDSDFDASKVNPKPDDEKKVKPKKEKKPKVTVVDAAAKIDPDHLAAHLADISGFYPDQQDIQMTRFADYYGRIFSAVNSAQFPWVKLLRESSVAKMTDIPLAHISDAVYKTSVDWINQRSIEALAAFVLWALGSILADLAAQQVSAKGSKKVTQQPSSKSQVAMFVVLAMVLRQKPDALISVLPMLRENSKYQGQEKLPVFIWMMTQASQGDLAVGLYAWAHNLLPLVGGKSCSLQSSNLILELAERILAAPKARIILVNGAVRKGERLVPPSALETLAHVTFPSARVKATERFEAIYPTLKEVALAGSHGSKAMKQLSHHILHFAMKAARESSLQLSREAVEIALWCLSENPECYRQWDMIYEENLEASVSVLRKLSEEWKQYSLKLIPTDPLKETLKSFRQKNAKAIASGSDTAKQVLYKDADKYCKRILRNLQSNGCVKALAFLIVAMGVGAAVILPNVDTLEWEKLFQGF